MSDYKEEANKKKVDKPWVVYYIYNFRGLSGELDAKPFRMEFAREANARHEYDKRVRQGWYKDVWIEHNGVRQP